MRVSKLFISFFIFTFSLSSCVPVNGVNPWIPSVNVINNSAEGYVVSVDNPKLGYGLNFFRTISSALAKTGSTQFRYTPVMINDKAVSFLVERPEGKDEFVQMLFSGVKAPGVVSLLHALTFMRTRTEYRRDEVTFSREDVWQSSREMLARRVGDCEDHAILLADLLMTLGYEVRVVFGRYREESHVWIAIMEKNGRTRLVEATSKDPTRFMKLLDPTEIHEYYPYLVFDNKHLYGLRKGGNPREMLDWVPTGRYVAGG